MFDQQYLEKYLPKKTNLECVFAVSVVSSSYLTNNFDEKNMPTPVSKKLMLKPGMKGLILDLPSDANSILDLPESIDIKKRVGKDYDFAIAFVTSMQQAEDRLPTIVNTVIYDGLLWMCYPKKTSKLKSDVSRDILWKAVQTKGFDGVAMISINDTWSAMRIRPIELVKSSRR